MYMLLCVVFGSAIAAVAAQDCVFQFEGEGVKYDLNALADLAPFTYASGPKSYEYSVCKPVTRACNQVTNAMAVVVAASSPADCFASYGSPGADSATLLGLADAGLQLSYSGGVCSSDSSKKSTVVYQIACDADGAPSPHLVQQPIEPDSGCELQLKFSSSAACPIRLTLAEVLSPGALVVLIIVSLILAYFVVGTLVNMGCRGASGVEAIPNIEFWRSLCGSVCSCCGCATPAGTPSGFYEEMDADVLPADGDEPASTRL